VQKRRSARTVRSATKIDSLPAKRSVSLTIAGQRLSIRTDKEEDYIHQLAEYVDEMVEELRRGTRSASTPQLYLLAALNMADELFQAQDRTEDLKEEIQRRTERLIRMLEGSSSEET